LWLHGNVEHFIGHQLVKISFRHTLELGLQFALLSALITYWRQGLTVIKRVASGPSGKYFLRGFIIGYFPAIVGYFFHQPPSSPGDFVSLPISISNVQLMFKQLIPTMVDANPFNWATILCGGLLWAVVLFTAIESIRTWRSHLGLIDFNLFPARSLLFVGFLNLIMAIFSVELIDIPSQRYLLPFMIFLPVGLTSILFAIGRRFRILALFLGSIWIGNNIFGVIQLARAAVAEDNYVLISQHLQDLGYRAGYADYWIAYRLSATSHEQVVIATTGNNDRYPPYLMLTQQQNRTFLLSLSQYPARNTIIIRGTLYQIERYEFIDGFFTDYLKKA
jgi:hypothetical protein